MILNFFCPVYIGYKYSCLQVGWVCAAHLFSFLCCFFVLFCSSLLCILSPMCPVSLDYTFLIAPFYFSKVYLHSQKVKWTLHSFQKLIIHRFLNYHLSLNNKRMMFYMSCYLFCYKRNNI